MSLCHDYGTKRFLFWRNFPTLIRLAVIVGIPKRGPVKMAKTYKYFWTNLKFSFTILFSLNRSYVWVYWIRSLWCVWAYSWCFWSRRQNYPFVKKWLQQFLYIFLKLCSKVEFNSVINWTVWYTFHNIYFISLCTLFTWIFFCKIPIFNKTFYKWKNYIIF